MSDPIVFTVTIPDGLEEQVTQVMQLGLLAIYKGCESYSIQGGTEFRFNQLGIDKIDQDKLDGLLALGAYGLSCSGQIGPRFLEMTKKEYASEVPKEFPESTKPTIIHHEESVGEDEVVIPAYDEVTGTEQMTFSEYLPFATQSLDKSSWLVQLSEVVYGETCGDGLSWDEYTRWAAAYPGRILSSGEGSALAASSKYQEV